jgi:hypothetical protein
VTKKRRKTQPQAIPPELTHVAFEASLMPPFPIVGIGASAGGLAAFEAFFSGLPADSDPGMAFVLVQHLAPEHKSLLAELIGRCTRLPVFEVEEGMVVQVNCVYVIPPGYDMAFLNGTLQWLDPSAARGQRLSIDFFFRSLAQDQHERAIGIVLSGTANDGTLGLRAVLDGRLPGFGLDYPYRCAEQQRWFSMSVTPLGDGAVIAHTDVTKLKIAWCEPMDFSHRIADNIGDFIAVLDPQGRRLCNVPSHPSFFDQTRRTTRNE